MTGACCLRLCGNLPRNRFRMSIIDKSIKYAPYLSSVVDGDYADRGGVNDCTYAKTITRLMK